MPYSSYKDGFSKLSVRNDRDCFLTHSLPTADSSPTHRHRGAGGCRAPRQGSTSCPPTLHTGTRCLRKQLGCKEEAEEKPQPLCIPEAAKRRVKEGEKKGRWETQFTCYKWHTKAGRKKATGWQTRPLPWFPGQHETRLLRPQTHNESCRATSWYPQCAWPGLRWHGGSRERGFTRHSQLTTTTPQCSRKRAVHI